MQLISMQQVTFGYTEVPSLEEVSLSIHTAEFVAVTGPNGASKSTLLKLGLQLLRPWSGSVHVSRTGRDGQKLRMGYVPQQVAAFNNGFPSTVLEFVRSGRYTTGSWLRRLNDNDHWLTEQALKQMGMWEQRKNKIGELSGGQRQRICMARALAQEPDIFLLDEPTTGMDRHSREHLYRVLHEQVTAWGRTVVMVTHNLAEVAPMLDRVIELARKENGGWRCCTTISCSGHFAPVGS